MAAFKKEILLDDERGRGFPAVVKYGPYLFVSGSDGHRDLAGEKIVPELADKPIEQCRNAYGRVRRRLEQAGFGGDCAVWIENFTSGQHWRLDRMALWPEYFGEVGHGQAVSFGSQTKMSGINMLTACVMAMTPDVPRVVAVKQPGRGRASRITTCGELVFVIGVRGHTNPFTRTEAPEETDGAFDAQLDNCFDWLKSHLSKAGALPDLIVRADSCIRNIGLAGQFRERTKRYFGGTIPFAGYAVGTPMGGRCEQEIGCVAAAPGAARDTAWLAHSPDTAEATRAGGLVFATSCSGLLDGPAGRILPALHRDTAGQIRQALRNVAKALGRFNAGLDRLVRLDVFIRDIYAEDAVIRGLKDVLGRDMPALNIIGVEPEHGAEIELVAIAGAA